MSFTDAVRSVLGQYAVFRGRARRAEYWWFALFAGLVTLVAAAIDAVLGTSSAADMGLVQVVVWLALLLPSLAVTVRRLHDTNRSGWWVLVGLLPILSLVLVVFLLLDGNPHANRFGSSPKQPTVAPGPIAAPGPYS
jgi:uncharacterized membrane protein YhaH (DUF805 family)